MLTATRRNRYAINIWPGFVDALATLLLVFIFMLVVFVMAQFRLSDALTRRASEIIGLTASLNDQQNRNQTLTDQLDQSRQSLTDLSAQNETLQQTRDRLYDELSVARQLIAAAERQAEELSAELDRSQSQLTQRNRQLQDRDDTVTRLTGQIEDQTGLLNRMTDELNVRDDALARLTGQLAAAEQRSTDLDSELTGLREQLQNQRQSLEQQVATLLAARNSLSDQLEQLSGQLADALVGRQNLQTRLSEAETNLTARTDELDATERQNSETRRLITLLEQQNRNQRERLAMIDSELNRTTEARTDLQQQLDELSRQLDTSRRRNAFQQQAIDRLQELRQQELANKVEELNRYRSDFFGQLRDVLGERGDIRIVGDRFLFQSELFFGSGSATLGETGKQQLDQVATAIGDVSKVIPNEIDWILQVNGHTDRVPINTPTFRSNWELSQARALSIVRYLIDQGIPPERLAAAGFAEFQPLDETNTSEAYRRNRRIELKLTSR